MLAGSLSLLAGIGLTLGAIATTTSAAFMAGAAVAGPGFGLAFLGSFRMIMAHATPGLRAGLVAAIYIVGYLAFSVPALIAGVATTKFGLHSTALVYVASLAAMPAVAVGILLSRAGGNAARPSAASRAVIPPARAPLHPALRPYTQRMDDADPFGIDTAKRRARWPGRAVRRSACGQERPVRHWCSRVRPGPSRRPRLR
jgi:MFS family permease